MPERRKIIILGGGVGALTAAYYLTSRADWRERYDIVLYQLGWRLGGKGASSRNSRIGCRIEEHGLHVWFGFYENAFALMRRVWKPRAGGGPASVEDAFRPLDDLSMFEERNGRWDLWPLEFPEVSGAPGTGQPVDSAWEVLVNLIEFVRKYTAGWLAGVPIADRYTSVVPDWAVRFVPRVTQDVAGFDPLWPIIRTMKGIGRDIALHKPDLYHDGIADMLHAFRTWAADRMQTRPDERELVRRIWLVADLSLTVAIGVLRDRLLFKGLEAADGKDFCEWLAYHGVNDAARYCTPVRALYDCCFAFDDGDTDRPNFAAGAALGCALRIGLMYRGHICYEMRMGMGEAVIAPLYQVLRDRGVRFEFFHRVKKLETDGQRITRVLMARQATLRNAAYDPLLTASDGMKYWPDRPLYEQLVEGDALREGDINLESHWTPWRDHDLPALEVGTGDIVVLGISLGALGAICEPLAAANPKWRELLDKLPAIQTQSAQLWMTRDLQQLGGPVKWPTMVAAPEPYDVWADMSHVISHELWPPGAAPASVQYLCGPMKGDYLERPPSDHGVPVEAWQSARDQIKRWLEQYGRALWTNSATPGNAFDWNLLHVVDGTQGEARLDRQWIRPNIDPSERYILSPRKLNGLRLPSARSGFRNLFLAGDWTRTAINAGCVEAAVMSGMEASRAICGDPETISGEHFMQG